MRFSYKRLWKLLIDRDLKKKDLIKMSGISQSSITKLSHDDTVNTGILIKICSALNCDVSDILELVPNTPDL
jgi:DNA-binding Xre family transcriptional regulator